MKKASSLILLFAFLVLINSGSSATDSSLPPDDYELQKKVDALFAEWDHWDSPGAALAVVKDGEVIYKRGYGSAQLEYNIPITPSTIFHVASVSKEFTAFAISLLEEQGKLSLDDDIHKYLPEVPDFGEKITIRHLIHHINGMRDQWQLLAMAGWRLDDVITKEHILKLVRQQRDLNFKPGAEYLYSNTGFTLLAEIVERITGKTFREWTAENIFTPLGMSNTHFHDDHEMVVKNRAYSYRKDDEGTWKKSVLSYANVGATSLFTTVEDLARWALNFEEKRVGGPAVIERMQEQGVLNNGEKISYARGLVISDFRGLRTVGHSGGDAGFRTHFLMFPEQRFSVIVFSNLAQFNPRRLAQQVAEIYLGDVMTPEEMKGDDEPKTVEIDPVVLDSYVGRFKLKIGIIVTIEKEGDTLTVTAQNEEKIAMHPVSETEFYIEEINGRITFEVDENGRVDKLVLVQGDSTIPGERIELSELSAEELGDYAGEYYSQELSTMYTLEVRDGGLVATHNRHSDIQLTHTGEDEFSGNEWFFSVLNFQRNESGKIIGFKLSGGRVRNLVFEKR